MALRLRDIKRLTRDATLRDGLEIASLLQRAGGLLITSERTWDLQVQRDYDDYCAELRVAAAETANMRSLFYEGQRQRAEAIVRGEAPPMFKGPPAVGYKAVSCFSSGDSVSKWQVDPRSGGAPLVHRGVPVRTWVKCAVCGPSVEALGEELSAPRRRSSRCCPRYDARALLVSLEAPRRLTLLDFQTRSANPAAAGHRGWRWSFQGRSCVRHARFGPSDQDESNGSTPPTCTAVTRARRTKQHEHLAAGFVACANCHDTARHSRNRD